MAQLVVIFDPKDRLRFDRPPGYPKDIQHAALTLADETLPDDPDRLKELTEKLAALLFDALTT